MDRQMQTGTGRWSEHSSKFSSEWEGKYGANKPWNKHEHAYRFGWEAGMNPKFHDKSFDDYSMDFERDWPKRYDNWADYTGDRVEGAWNDFKDTVREGWDAARREFSKTF